MKQVFLVIALLIAQYSLSIAQWSQDPTVNVPICTATGDQYLGVMISDGAGGAIITWYDYRSGTEYDIYAQKIDASGVVQWTAGGVAISTAANSQNSPTIVSDGAGGAIITWSDYRSGTENDIYAQKIDASGVVQWTAGGVPVSTASGNQLTQVIVSDGAGGAIITWEDQRSGPRDIYAQRINGSGTVQWTPNGVAINISASDQVEPRIATDGAGGAIIVWYDFRDLGTTSTDIYAQRINASGAVQWTAGGVAISTAAYGQQNPVIVADGSGGAIIAWRDHFFYSKIYAQRINAAGSVNWTANGIPIATPADCQSLAITTDVAGGAIMTWEDARGGDADIYAQRVNSVGSVQWTTDGVPVSTASSYQSLPAIVSDSAGGAIIVWDDYRDLGATNADIYAQRINSAGVVHWTADGVAVSTAPGAQLYPVILNDGARGAMMAWTDQRNGIDYNVYMDKLDSNGLRPTNNPVLTSVRDVPGDQGGKVTVAWNGSYPDVYHGHMISFYSIWRGINTGVAIARSAYLAPGETPGPANARKFRAVNGINWEWIDNMPAHSLTAYSYTAATTSDSTATGATNFKFFVSAQTADQYVYWDSNVDSGYSVDNLPPGAVLALAAEPQAGPSVNVHWKKNTDDPDVGYYEVHRSTTDGFIPQGGTTKIGQTADTMLVDASPVSGSNNYYRIVTSDIHGNMSSPSMQAFAGVTTTVPYGVANKWNLVSVPLTVSNYSKSLLFPTATSNAFAYQNGYSAQATLANGVGYWLKFGSVQTIGGSLPGLLRTQDSISVQAGWNMIGSISSSVATSGITSNPGGMVTSNFFGYNNGYVVSNTIEPGKGYWVKVNQSGKLILASSGTVPAAHRIQIVQTSELPPSPPEFEINNSQSAIPKEFALDQNYPNPFNPTTVIQYAVPSSQYVSLKVYNMLGEVVATLVDGVQGAGYKSVKLDASKLSSGVYTYRLSAGNFSETRKMLLMK